MKHQHNSQTKNAIAQPLQRRIPTPAFGIAPPQPESARAPSSLHPIEELQSEIGNQAVNQLLARQPIVQAKPMFRGLSHELIQTQSENKTGLPDSLKAGIESLSGMAMDDVKVHYNSSEPAKLQAYAYTEGTNVHVASGQEKHLPHEAWHLVQQKQGRVKPSVQLKGIDANIDFFLEKEANIMGAKAKDIGDILSRFPSNYQAQQSSQLLGLSTQTLQRTTGTPVRQFGNGGTVPQNTLGTDPVTVEREALVEEGLVTTGEIFDVEVARNFVKNKVKSNVIQTVTRHVRQYYISDTTHYFYTATSDEAAESILINGLDPNFGGKREPNSITGWNSRGHVYFTLEPSTANGYGKKVIKPKTGSYTLLRFTLPLRHPVTLDPELGPRSSALRTNVLIPANNIERVENE